MKKEKFKIGTALLLCVSIIFFVGCGLKDDVSKGGETAGEVQEEQLLEDDKAAPADAADAPVSEGEDVSDSVVAENEENSDEENAEKAQALYEAQIRHYYSGALTQLIAARRLPDGEMLREDVGEAGSNDFALTDIDQDGREELIIRWRSSYMASMFEAVYDYNPVSGELKMAVRDFPALTYYDNGIIKAEWSHNQGPGEFWPFTLYRYEPDSDSYVDVGSVETWDKEMRAEWYDGQPFPDELDTDGDGTMYNIHKEGEKYSGEYEAYKYNQADFDEWFGGYTEGAKELSIEYQPIEYESFAEYTPAYLKLLAGEAGEERTDTASDLGLLILNEEYFLDAAKDLLSNNYDVKLEQPQPDFEEWTVGLKDGREVFSFEALNAGHIGYKGEQVDDVTIFGIYPGIRVDGAWGKLKAYGFYASPYGEVENCLITGEGFGNMSIWFSAEDNVVTEITVGPY